MSKTVAMNLTSSEILQLCTAYKCTDAQLARVLKASLLGHQHSQFYRSIGEFGAERLIEEIKKADEYETSEKTKKILHTIFGEYRETLKEYLKANPL